MSLAEDPNLAGLYPFLHGKKQDPLLMNSALLESVGQKAAHHQKVVLPLSLVKFAQDMQVYPNIYFYQN